MQEQRAKTQVMNLSVTEGLSVTIIPNSNFEFLMTSKEVAHAYGVSYGNIREHMRVNDDFIEGKHFLKGVSISDTQTNVQPHQIFWTKRGIIRLGFFIKSERAKLFRDWAEDLILSKLENPVLFDVPATRALPTRRKHNRLTQERLLSIIADVCSIEDKELRMRITRKLMGGQGS